MRRCVLGAARCSLQSSRPFHTRNFSTTTTSGKILWEPTPEVAKKTQIVDFALRHAPKYGYVPQARPAIDDAHRSAVEAVGVDYFDLWRWSVSDLSSLHTALWDYLDIRHSQKFEQPFVLDQTKPHQMAGTFAAAEFYPGAKLNFAENVLRYADDSVQRASTAEPDRDAMLWYSETRAASNPRRISFAELRQQVSSWSRILREDLGVKKGDTVCGFLPVLPETNVVALAAIAVGATWSSCSTDFGEKGTLDRFTQIRPKVLFAAAEYFHKGRRVVLHDRLERIVDGLLGEGLQSVVMLDYDPQTTGESAAEDAALKIRARGVQTVQTARELLAGRSGAAAIEYEQVDVSHPVYTLFSSGTTGLPKCMQQGFGVFITHNKEHRLLFDMSEQDRYLQYTTTGWMMWNYQLSALATGATLVLYEGDPLTPGPAAIYDVLQHSNTSVFGTSARFLGASSASGVVPKDTHNLSLRTVLSTGSPASENTFEFASTQLKPGLQFLSVSGGTDLNGCFLGGAPILPVRDGELQAPALGMDVAILDDDGQRMAAGQGPGELCCLQPFASQPLQFLNDDAGGSKYRAAYFEQLPGVWCHGDFAEAMPSGGLVIHGRSDATLNPGGVRIGTADIYGVVERELSDMIADCVAVGRPIRLPDGLPDVEIVLFVKMREGATLGDEEVKRVKATIRQEASPRHVPTRVIEAPAIPLTANGKKVEVAVRKAVAGQEVKNRGALANPESLEWYYALKWD